MSAAAAQESDETTDEDIATAPDSIPDIREEKLKLKIQDRN